MTKGALTLAIHTMPKQMSHHGTSDGSEYGTHHKLRCTMLPGDWHSWKRSLQINGVCAQVQAAYAVFPYFIIEASILLFSAKTAHNVFDIS